MTGASALRDDLGHPLAESLLSFNLLPSRWIHPTRMAALMPHGWDTQAALSASILHRHLSASLLHDLAPCDLVSLEDPVVPLCLVTESVFEAVALHAGLLVLAPAVRRLIARSEVSDLALEVGAESVDFARHAAKPLRSGDQSPALSTGRCREQALRLGHALLSLAFDRAQPGLAVRARLRLPADAAMARGDLPPDLADAGAALAACMGVLRYLEPEWPSSFPDHR